MKGQVLSKQLVDVKVYNKGLMFLLIFMEPSFPVKIIKKAVSPLHLKSKY